MLYSVVFYSVFFLFVALFHWTIRQLARERMKSTGETFWHALTFNRWMFARGPRAATLKVRLLLLLVGLISSEMLVAALLGP